MIEETTKLPVLSENFDKQKEIYLSRPTAEKSWNEDVERQLEGLTAEQKGEVLRAANASHLNLVDLSPYIAMLVLSNRTLDTCAAGVQESLSSYESRLSELRRNESRSFEKTNYRMTQMISQLDDSLQAILKRIDEALELFDKTSTEAVENLKSKLEPEKIAADATTQARRGFTKQIFKELSEKLKGYIEAEVQAEIHKRTTLLNLMWVTAVILVGVAGFWMGKH